MKTIQIELFNYEELSDEAKERALADRNENHDDPLLQSHMINLLAEELDERGIKYGYPNKDLDVRYSLSHSQGDGFMFEGTLTLNGRDVTITHHDPHYYHSRTANFDYGEDEDGPSEADREAFEKQYREICSVLEEKGYSEIEYQRSAECFAEECEANEYTFEKSGAMRNV